MSNNIRVIERTFTILELLSNSKNGLSIKEITENTDLSKSTVHRFLSTLQDLGYISQNTDTGIYRINLKILALGNRILEDMNIINIAKPYLMELNKEFGETVHLVTLEGNEIVYIDKIESNDKTIRMHSHIGARLPLVTTAVGKCIMANFSEKKFEDTWESVKSDIKKVTEYTITKKEDMEDELQKCRINGYGTDFEENELGIICIAAPIYNYKNEVEFAVSCSTPKYRFDVNAIDKLSDLVKKCAMGISRELGYIS